MKLIEYYFPIIYGEHASFEIKRIQKIYYDLLKECQSKLTSSKEVGFSTMSSLMLSLNIEENDDSIDDFELFVSNTTLVENVKLQLDHYMGESFLLGT